MTKRVIAYAAQSHEYLSIIFYKTFVCLNNFDVSTIFYDLKIVHTRTVNFTRNPLIKFSISFRIKVVFPITYNPFSNEVILLCIVVEPGVVVGILILLALS